MKKLLFVCIASLMAFTAVAQDEMPTINWPYLYPDFMEGEITQVGGKSNKSLYNIHLGMGGLHVVNDGLIAEISTQGVVLVTIGGDVFRNVEGKMMKVLAQSEGGFVVQETLADYSAVVRDDGAYGGSLANAAKGFSYDENYGNYGYLVTNNYEDLLSIKNQSEELAVTQKTYLIVKNQTIPANKKSVTDLEGIDKKAFSEFLKSGKISWKDPQDLVKVVDYIALR